MSSDLSDACVPVVEVSKFNVQPVGLFFKTCSCGCLLPWYVQTSVVTYLVVAFHGFNFDLFLNYYQVRYQTPSSSMGILTSRREERNSIDFPAGAGREGNIDHRVKVSCPFHLLPKHHDTRQTPLCCTITAGTYICSLCENNNKTTYQQHTLISGSHLDAQLEDYDAVSSKLLCVALLREC